MSSELSRLVRQRGALKGQLTRISNGLKREGNIDLETEQVRQKKLHEIESEFNTIQLQIEYLDDNDSEAIREEFENLHFETAVIIQKRINQLTPERSTNSVTTDNSANTPSPQTSQPVQSILPKIQIKQFSGNFTEWQSFHDTFKSLVHENDSIPTVHKFHLLKSYLSHEVASVLGSLYASEENYFSAWNQLLKRFNKPRRIVQGHVRALFELPDSSKNSPLSMRTLADRAEMHINSLKALGKATNCHEILIYLITARLDKDTRLLWERSLDDDKDPTVDELFTFLNKYARDVEPIAILQPENNRPKTRNHNYETVANHKPHRQTQICHSAQHSITCPVCKKGHYIIACTEFLDLKPKERSEIARKYNLCLNCLRAGHGTSKCRSGPCRRCNKHHHTLLHFTHDTSRAETNSNSEENPTTSPIALTANSNHEILLSTARIKIIYKYGREHYCRVLLDGGSQSNFMTKKLADILQLDKYEIDLPVTGLGQQETIIKHRVKTIIRARDNSCQHEAEFYILPNITSLLPSKRVNRHSISIPTNITLADPEFDKPAEIQALLGEYLFYKLLSVGQIRIPNQRTVLQKTRLGWVISGSVAIISGSQGNVRCHVSTNILNKQIAKFWELEECPSSIPWTRDEEACEAIYNKTVARDTSGRYIVSLPFNEKRDKLGESFKMAARRFYALEKRLDQNLNLRIQYNDFMDEYIRLNHMTDVTNNTDANNGYYLPHHAVMKEASLTTKLRVVFDGSAKTTTGVSLNEALLVGPKIQDDLFILLIRFRSYAYVLTADIEKMFRQIWIHPQHRSFQKILWRSSSSQPLKTYTLNTVTYGTTPAPFLAVRCLQNLAEIEGHHFPLAANCLKTDFYMDDLLTGAGTVKDALKLRDELIDLTKRGGFNLRQWATNEPRLLKNIRNQATQEHLLLDTTESRKTLGIQWHAQRDEISYDITNTLMTSRITKRSILSEISKLFDPLGLLGPILITGKLLVQELWKLNIGWDETVPPTIHNTWTEYRDNLISLRNFQVPREIVIKDPVNIQLHGFCDASERAFGACIYLRSSNKAQQIVTRLICSKSRVAPLKTISLPRLELCAAVLLARLSKVVRVALKLDSKSVRLWSDFTITLHWIKASPHKLKTFVANRVTSIQNLTEGCTWSHVSSGDNPADHVSRGQDSATFLENTMWLQGPRWLSEYENAWPQTTLPQIEVPEQRTIVSLPTITLDAEILSRYSSFSRLQRVVAYCLRFRHNCLHDTKFSGQLTLKELDNAHDCVIRILQAYCFAKELHSLKKGISLPKNSKLISLNPFIDKENIIRVGGRIKNAEVDPQYKHPIVLPRAHAVTKAIITREHIKQLHGGLQTTLNAVRQRYWPLDGKNTTRFLIHNCIRCFKVKPNTTPNYIMSDLPKYRVRPTRPFENTGIDYCGPFQIKEKRIRNTKYLKVYVAVFVCLVTKAIHLELVSDLTTDAFLASLKRFTARRGQPKNIYTDNGTNFVGARNELYEIQNLVRSDEHNNTVSHYLTNQGIQWHFLPPRSPHFGGLWEAVVKSFKHHFYRMARETRFTYEEFNTLTSQIEAVLNSRPLTPLSSDPNDLQALTPGHFLISDYLTSIAEHDLSDSPVNRLSVWQHIQQVRQHFWKRWQREYLHELQTRTKWKTNNPTSIKVGTMVIVKEDQLPPMRWSLGRITEVHPGRDGIIRVATVKTSVGTYIRNLTKLCPLPIETNVDAGHPSST